MIILLTVLMIINSEDVCSKSNTIEELNNIIEAQEHEILNLKKIINDKKYNLTEEEAIQVANKIKSLEEEVSGLKELVSKQNELIEGQKKEIKLQEKYISSLENHNDMLRNSLINQKEAFDSALDKANEVINLQGEEVALKDEIIKDQEKMYSMSFIDKIQFIAIGVAVYSVADLVFDSGIAN